MTKKRITLIISIMIYAMILSDCKQESVIMNELEHQTENTTVTEIATSSFSVVSITEPEIVRYQKAIVQTSRQRIRKLRKNEQ